MSESAERERFFHAVDLRRRQLKLSWKDVCAQADIHQSVPTALGRGRDVMGASIFRLSAWLHDTRRMPEQPVLIEPQYLAR